MIKIRIELGANGEFWIEQDSGENAEVQVIFDGDPTDRVIPSGVKTDIYA